MSIEEFKIREEPGFWKGIRSIVEVWDDMIRDFNDRSGVLSSL